MTELGITHASHSEPDIRMVIEDLFMFIIHC